MVVAYSTRPSRDYDFVPGIGSSVEIAQRIYTPPGGTVSFGAVTVLDIEQGFIRETFRNKNTTHSGSNGADLYTRVGMGWMCRIVLSFPGDVEGGLRHSFIETLMGSSRGIAMKFNIGDPEVYWKGLNMQDQARNFRADKALLGPDVETRFDSTGLEVVGVNLACIGSSLLWTWEGNTKLHPGIWF